MKISTVGEESHEVIPGTFLLGYRGSHSHGLYVPPEDVNSIDDIDLMGFAFGETKHYFGLESWGSRGTKDFWEGRLDLVYYEIKKAFALLLQGNPNIVSMLWLNPSDYLFITEAGKELVKHRNLFSGKHVYDAFAGYASAQLQKMESRDPAELREYLAVTHELKVRGAHPNKETAERREPNTGEARDVVHWDTEKLLARMRHYHRKGENLGYMGDKRKHLVLEHGYDAKNAAHCVRLLRMAKEFLETGEFYVRRTHDRQELLDIKAGKWALADIKALAESLFAEVKAAKAASPLPEKPDAEGVQKLLIEMLEAHFYGIK